MAKKESKELYFNFPVQLLSGFLNDHVHVLHNIVYYGLYAHTLKLKHGDYYEKFNASLKYYGLTYEDSSKAMEEAEDFYWDFNKHHGSKNPMVGINKNIYFRYLNNETSEFSKVCLLGFLAMKSILQRKPYCKMNNLFWLSRMDGRAKKVDSPLNLSSGILKYFNEYQTKKIKNELQDNWNLVHYARYTRGFYVSFKLDKEKLMYEAEMKRKSTKEKQRKFEEKAMLKRVLKSINNPN